MIKFVLLLRKCGKVLKFSNLGLGFCFSSFLLSNPTQEMVSKLSIRRWVSIKMHHQICLVFQKMQEKLYIFTSENFFPLLCSLCFSKALSLQKRLNLNLFTSKPKLSLPNPFLFSSFNSHFLEIPFFEVFSVLSFVFVPILFL